MVSPDDIEILQVKFINVPNEIIHKSIVQVVFDLVKKFSFPFSCMYGCVKIFEK